MTDGAREYDQFARKRILLALTKIHKRKKLTWEQLALRIQAHTRVTFDRRYFGRLRHGGLNNDIVHNIVRTIDAKFIPGFLADVHADAVNLPFSPPAKAGLTYVGTQYLHWAGFVAELGGVRGFSKR